MKAKTRSLSSILLAIALALAAVTTACGTDEPPPTGPALDTEPDPLEVKTTPAPGSLDELHARVIEKRCSGQPGLCHNGQFEPNLSTPGLTYAYLVNRPSIEKPNVLRVRPGNAAQSLFIDKIRNRNGVATQMPLGAAPLEEAEVAEIERWINDGALRAPGASAAPTLNNPPRRPQVAIYSGTTRLDGGGPITVSVGTTLTLRHSVHDFETLDASIPFAAVILQDTATGDNVVITTGNDPHVGPTTYDANGPMGQGDQLNYARSWTIPAMFEPWDDRTKTRKPATSTAGKTFQLAAVYIDSAPPQGIVALDVCASTFKVQ